jgi:catechol 1,2-dioxygenase
MLTTIFVFVIALITTKVHAQQACQLTDPDILGPYYIPGAPRSVEQLCASSPANDRLVLTGQVVDYDSKCTRGIPNVKLDLWQVIKNKKESNGFS